MEILQGEAGSDLLLQAEAERENRGEESRGSPFCHSSGNNSCMTEEDSAETTTLKSIMWTESGYQSCLHTNLKGLCVTFSLATRLFFLLD